MDIRDGLITIKNFVSKEEGEKLSKYILEYESTIKSLGPDIYGGTSNDSLTGRFNVFNYLEHEPGEILNPKLKDMFGECLVQCWATTFRKGEGIEPHKHSNKFRSGMVCANLFLSGVNNGTWYEAEGDIINEIGTLVVFPNDYVHGVKPNTSDAIRISMAFDIYTLPKANTYHVK